MALLSRAVISHLIQAKELVIDPPSEPEDFEIDSVEVHLGSMRAWKKSKTNVTHAVPLWTAIEKGEANPFNYSDFAEEYLVKIEPDHNGLITMRPHNFYLASLKQYVKLPKDVAMHVQGKSSLARLGVMVHVTAPHAHAGWDGHLTLEIYNLGPFNIELKEGIAMGQLTFWRLESLDGEIGEHREGAFRGQQDPAGKRK